MVSVPEGRSKTTQRSADVFQRAVAPTVLPDSTGFHGAAAGGLAGMPTVPPDAAAVVVGADTVRPGHGKTRQFRLGATFRPDPEPEATPGSFLGAQERYRVVRFLGQGGMGRVYEARRERDGHRAAVKVLRTDRAAGNLAELIARFRQEAAAASRVGHRGIVEMLGFEQAPDGQVIVAMELLQGEPLEDWMAREGTLGEGLGLLAALCDALHAAHEAGIVHRDIKPANLFLHREQDGTLRPTVLDFGLAKVELPDHTQIETAAGTVLGTPYYLAPERALGKPLDRRADLYSVGVVLYELITGSLPFEANSFMAVLEGHVRRVPLDPRQAAPERPIPAGVCELAMALLAKDPDVRPQTAAEVAARVRALQAQHHAELERCPTGPRARPDASADTISILALAAGHTAAPGASAASAEAVTIAPLATGPNASSVHVSPSASSPARSRVGPFVGLAAVLGVAAFVGVGLSRPADGDAPVAAQPSPASAPGPASPPATKPRVPASIPAPKAALASGEPIESVVAVPKARPSEAASPQAVGKPPGSGTNAAAKKPRRRKAPTIPETPVEAPKSSLPAFKDHVYED